MAADNIVSLNRHKGGPDSELAQSNATGEARMRELERLIKTASDVQAQAEAELSQSTASQSVAQQRKAAAESVRRKAEAEMAKLRNELARQAEREKQVWSPGDPVPTAKQQVKSDFEVSTLTGTASRGRFSDSAFLDSDLALNEEDTHINARINSSSGSKNRQRRSKSSTYRSRRGSKRGWALGLIMLLGISAGAGVTWLGTQDPDVVGEQVATISDRISNMIPVTVELKSAQQEQPAPEEQVVEPAPVIRTKTPPAKSPEQLARQQAAWQQAIAQQDQRVREAAAIRFKDRTR